jgi:hypothetical protein
MVWDVIEFDRGSTCFPNHDVDAPGFANDPDPSRYLLFGWAAAP